MTPQFEDVLKKMPRIRKVHHLVEGELIAAPSRDGWMIGVFDGRKTPPHRTVFLSEGRDKDDPQLAFQAAHNLSELLYATKAEDYEDLRGGQLVAATWWFPDWDWHINELIHEGNSIGFPTTDGMWGGVIENGEILAQGAMVVCDLWGPREWRPKRRKKR